MKIRLDKLLVERGFAATRERAQALILAGRVLVSEQKLDKPGHAVDQDAPIRLLGTELRYVSRGGLKLEAALAHWHIDLTGRFCLDVGASTGGFTDCMLQHGAARVLAIDTGYGQIAQSLRDDPRVTLMERTNARLLHPGDLPPGITFLAMDVSFISATLVLPPVLAAIRADTAGATVARLPDGGSALKRHDVNTATEQDALKGHDFSRAEDQPTMDGALAPDATSPGRVAPEASPPGSAHMNEKAALKGHDFSRAVNDAKKEGALAPEASPPGSAHINENAALKGHDFSRAVDDAKEEGALAPEGSTRLEAVLLIKPQFEAGRQHVGKGGIVRDPAAHQLAIDRVRACVEENGGTNMEVIDSPITGTEGNREFLLHARFF